MLFQVGEILSLKSIFLNCNELVLEPVYNQTDIAYLRDLAYAKFDLRISHGKSLNDLTVIRTSFMTTERIILHISAKINDKICFKVAEQSHDNIIVVRSRDHLPTVVDFF